MKTIILDIDGTLTDMWPIEKSVLVTMLGTTQAAKIEALYRSGIQETYKIFRIASGTKISKTKYRASYNRTFLFLSRKKRLPRPKPYPAAAWVRKNKRRYHFVYATGGQMLETRYVLKCLGLDGVVDVKNSISKSEYRFSKKTGLPFKKIKSKFPNCIVITDSDSDVRGAQLANVPYIQV